MAVLAVWRERVSTPQRAYVAVSTCFLGFLAAPGRGTKPVSRHFARQIRTLARSPIRTAPKITGAKNVPNRCRGRAVNEAKRVPIMRPSTRRTGRERNNHLGATPKIHGRWATTSPPLGLDGGPHCFSQPTCAQPAADINVAPLQVSDWSDIVTPNKASLFRRVA